MRLLIDQNVPDSVAQLFRARSHEVLLVRETLGREAPDQLIAPTAAREGLVIVTLDKDFRRFRKQAHTERQHPFLIGAGLLHIAMKETLGLARLNEEMVMIEAYALRAVTHGKFLRILLREAGIEFALEGGRVIRRPG
jgi:predicted nuclease of predicted toxin-antitoxin system